MALHTYTPYEWKNAPDHKTTPLSADNLNHIEQGIKNAEDDVAEVDTNRKADLTSISQTGSTASQAISAGTYFYLDGTLVRAKTAIANGATFTLNTNYEVTTIGEGVADSGWQTLNANVRYRKIGCVVYVEATSVSSGGDWSLLGTLPASVAPSKELITSVYTDTNNSVELRIYTNGSVTNFATASNVTGVMSYPLG